MDAQKPFPDPPRRDEEDEDRCSEIDDDDETCNNINASLCFPLLLLQQDLFSSDDDEDLRSLFARERGTHLLPHHLHAPRARAVEWVLRAASRHAFSPLTATLAVNYLDRFLLSGTRVDGTRPWITQLAAVACLSLAAKVEETHAPLLLDLQAEDATHVFEAKTIQRMELMVLAKLQWRMNPVTPLSFFDHVIRRSGCSSTYFHSDFLATCHNLLLSVISDPRLVHYLPSVLATATMLHVINRVDPTNGCDCDYENQLLGVLKFKKEEVDGCYRVILDVVTSKTGRGPLKRGLGLGSSDDESSSNDSWASSCVSSSSSSPSKKARRIQEQQMRLPSLSRVFVGSPN